VFLGVHLWLIFSMPQVRDILRALDARFPFARAEKWDRTGLLIGSTESPAERVLVAYEITDEVLACSTGFDCVVTYHPLLFRPLETLDFSNHTARLAAECIRRELSVVAVHTALDGAPLGHALGDALAQSLGLGGVQVLAPSGHGELVALSVFVPRAHAEGVAQAMWEAGAGALGNYDRASFRTLGEGTFRPLTDARPTVGEVGRTEFVAETKLEMIVPKSQQSAVIAAMKAAHPYEEVAHFVVPLLNRGGAFGAARVGVLEEAMPLDGWAREVEQRLGAPNVRIVRGRDTVQKIACVPGSGASFLDDAARAGVDCLVSGDFKHHDALKARAVGISLVDASHAATERATTGMLARALESTCEAEICGAPMNPFEAL
jgi:dinuclear metal center YbgI/SA1388 family protein